MKWSKVCFYSSFTCFSRVAWNVWTERKLPDLCRFVFSFKKNKILRHVACYNHTVTLFVFKQQREKSSMPEDRTWCSRGNLGRFEEHSVTRCCVWGESCGGNPQLEQNKTEDARNKIFWGWIVISCCKMCLLLCKNEGLVEIFFVFLPFFKSGVFLCMMHISFRHNTLCNKG